MSNPPVAPVADGAAALPAELEAWRARVEQRLEVLWNGIHPTPSGDAGRPGLDVTPHAFAGALRYAVLSPGKRVRPVLVLAARDAALARGTVEPSPRAVVGAAGDDDLASAAIDVACAFELVHAYSLVHDDLPSMDDDDLRRGRPTTHVQFDEATAILVGDALQAEAFALVARALAGRGDLAARVVVQLAEAAGAAGLVGGQFLDVTHARAATDLAALRDLHDRKTGALLAGAVAAGATIAGCDAASVDAFAAFGRELGWLFQLVDDLLDQVGDTARTGKATGRDERHDKVTAIAVFGSVAALESACDDQLDRCLELAAALPGSPTPGGQLVDLARFVRGRDR